VDLLVAAGGAAEVLPVSLSCPLPLLRIQTRFIPILLLFCFCEDGSNQYSIRMAGSKSICLESGVRGKIHFGIILVSAVSGI
jgi:hypothetical protein